MRAFNPSSRQGFTLLEIMVSVAVLGLSIVPLLLLREVSFNKAVNTKAMRTAQELAKRTLSMIALEVRGGTGDGSYEDWPQYRYEYTVTLYDFSAGMEADLEEEMNDNFDRSDYPEDSIYLDEDSEEEIGPMVMRHVELTVFFPSLEWGGEEDDEGGMEEEYIVDTYMPPLLTEEQFEKQQETGSEEY